MLIPAGTLTKKISIYKRVIDSTNKGYSAVSYEFYKDKFSDWKQLTSRELMRNQIEYNIDIFTVRIRQDKSITVNDQVRYKGRSYNITSVTHDDNVQSTILTLEGGVTYAE